MESSVEILAALVAGLLALIGGYFGARASRRTEYDKWLRQERSLAFASFLRELHKTWLDLPNNVFRNPAISPEADRFITEAFVRLEPSKNVVRLYLDEKDREPFSSLVHEIWVAQTSGALTETTRSQKTHHAMLAIQQIFETRLHA
jgi:hypothetical protein